MTMTEETAQQLITQIATVNARLTLIQHEMRRLPALSEDMAVVKSQMLALLGNGQPGRVARLEASVAANEQLAREQEQKLRALISERAEDNAFFRGRVSGAAIVTGSLSGFLALIFEAVKVLKGIR